MRSFITIRSLTQSVARHVIPLRSASIISQMELDALNARRNALHPESDGMNSHDLIEMEEKYAAHNYHPIPVVFKRAEGVFAWDPEGKRYFDFLSAYSAVNQGHCHPKIVAAFTEQAKKQTLSSRAFFNSEFPRFAKYITSYFGFERVLPMNSGAEAVETALKVARKWGYRVKKVPENQAIIVVCKENFHGRTLGIISMSTDPDSYGEYGPFLPGFQHVPFDDVDALRQVLEKSGKNVVGFLVEPIQGEAGVVVPKEGYLKQCSFLCKQHNVLFIADEIQTGLSRTGRLLACDWDLVRPDILILGKALSGGMMPVSAILCDSPIMDVITPGTHGSTYGGNPLASAVGIAALQVLEDEQLASKSDRLGERLRTKLRAFQQRYPFITTVRGKGLLNAIVIAPQGKKTAWDLCLIFKDNGLLAKPTHDDIIRLAPPLVITEKQIDECVDIIGRSLEQFATLKK